MEATTYLVSPKVKIILVKTAKGYRWSVEVTDEDPDLAMQKLEQVEQALKQKYGNSA